MVTKEDFDEIKEIIRKNYDVELTDWQVEELGETLVGYAYCLYQMRSEDLLIEN